MFTFIHAADIHLDSPMHKLEAYDGAPIEDFRLSTRRALENLIDLAISEKVAFVLISGDLYDGVWKDYNTGLYFIHQMTRLRAAGIRALIVAGNHDAASTITRSLRLPDNVTFFPAGRAETVLLDDPPVAIHGRSFASPDEKSDLSTDYPAPVPGRFNIGMLHTCAAGRPGHEPYAPCNVGTLQAKGYHYWALGHIHQHEILARNPLVVFSGNTQGRHIREPGPRGCVLVRVDGQLEAGIEFMPTDVARWIPVTVDVQDVQSPYAVVEEFISRLETVVSDNSGIPLAVRVTLSGESPVAGELAAEPDRWTGEIRAAAMEAGGSRVWVEKVMFACRLPEALEEPPAGSAVSELLALFRELGADPAGRQEVAEVLSDFHKKLPRELKEGPEGIRCDDPEWIREVLMQVRPGLLGRLMKKGGN